MSKHMSEEERGAAFKEFLESTAKQKACETCEYANRNWRGGYGNPCKKGNKDSGRDKEFCENHPDSKYHPKQIFILF